MRWLALLFLISAGCTLVCSNNRSSCPISAASPAFQSSNYCYSDDQCGPYARCIDGGCISANSR